MSDRFLQFEKAREFARNLKLSSSVKWFEYCKSPDFPTNIPKRPERTYSDLGWNGYSDWLGNGQGKYLLKGKGRLSFEEAREFVLKLHLPGLNGWIEYCKSGKRPANIPASPHTAYKDEWKGYGDWTGTGKKRYTDFLPFEEAREFIRSLNIKNGKEWAIFVKSGKKPITIPAKPDKYYGKTDEWTNWYDWLGQIRGNSGQGAATRRVISRFQELNKLGFSKAEILDTLSSEFPRKSENDIQQIILKYIENS